MLTPSSTVCADGTSDYRRTYKEALARKMLRVVCRPNVGTADVAGEALRDLCFCAEDTLVGSVAGSLNVMSFEYRCAVWCESWEWVCVSLRG